MKTARVDYRSAPWLPWTAASERLAYPRAGREAPHGALAACRDEGRLWVITGADDRPAGFLVTGMVDGCVHIEQVSVDPGSARRGLGRALHDHAAERAATASVPALTLTTFADVPWNAPYYVRCGFRVLDDGEVTPGLRAIWQREVSFWMGRWPRVCMRRDL